VSGITQTAESLGSAEKITGHKWNYVKPGKGHPVDYVVPNFGVDEDIKVAQANIAAQESTLGHAWVPEQDDNGYWVVPGRFRQVLHLLRHRSLVLSDAA